MQAHFCGKASLNKAVEFLINTSLEEVLRIHRPYPGYNETFKN